MRLLVSVARILAECYWRSTQKSPRSGSGPYQARAVDVFVMCLWSIVYAGHVWRCVPSVVEFFEHELGSLQAPRVEALASAFIPFVIVIRLHLEWQSRVRYACVVLKACARIVCAGG